MSGDSMAKPLGSNAALPNYKPSELGQVTYLLPVLFSSE